jgi:dTDP-L-rhamnose 4-epimerase
MSKKVLITGGAGFIGSHLADELLAHGHAVRVLDNLSPRVHRSGRPPAYLNLGAELVVGDVRDGALIERVLDGIDAVFHFAAAVGAGESVFEVDRCMSVNNVGTAVLLDRLARSSVERLVVGSSMCVYGEGLYRDLAGNLVEVQRRRPEQLRRAEWEHRDLLPMPTPESKTPCVQGSVYASSKYDQERMCLRFGRVFNVSTVSLRFFNVFGSRQQLANPYTGDLARFASRLLSGRRPTVPEDGKQLRDYVDIRDAVTACRLVLETDGPLPSILNIGSGRARSVGAMARRMAVAFGAPELAADSSGDYQLGDVRHCTADITRAEAALRYRPAANLDEGLLNLVSWVARQTFVPGIRSCAAARDYNLELAS